MAQDEVKVKLTLEDQVSQGLGKVKSGLGGVKEAAEKFTASAAVVSGGLGLFVKSALDGAAKAEQMQVAFSTMLGSADKAKETLASLTSFAAKTPFQLPEVQDAAKKLLAFGTAAEDLEPTLRKLGDVSAGIGAPIGEISELYGKAKVQGRLFAEDINQLTGRGIPIITELAEVLGTTEGNVKKMVEQGKVGFPELEKAFTNMTAQGSQFGGLMAAQSATFGGQISNIQDSLGQLLVSIGESLLPVAKQVAEFLGGLITWFQALSPETKETIAQAIALAAGLAGVITVIGGLISLFNPITIGIGLVVGAFVLWKTKGQEIMDFFIYWGGEIAKAFQAAFDKVVNSLVWVSTTISETWTALWNGVFAFFEAAWAAFMGVFEPYIQIFTGIFTAATALVQGNWSAAWEAIKGVFNNVWTVMLGIGKAMLGSMGKVIDEGLKLIGVNFDNIIKSVTDAWSNFWKTLESVVEGAKQGIMNMIQAIVAEIEKVIAAFGRMVNEARAAAAKIPGIGGLFGGAKAAGGPVSSGKTYLVGEQGPELFSPASSGNIIPNHKLAGGGSSIIININGIVSSRDVAEQYADQIVRKLQLSSAVV